jgi:hypothetical protein
VALSGAHVVLAKSPEITREAMAVILITAIVGARAVMIETDAAQEGAWLELVRSCSPASLVHAAEAGLFELLAPSSVARSHGIC